MRNQHTMQLNWEGKSKTCKSYIAHLKYWYDLTATLNLSLEQCDTIEEVIWKRNYKVNLENMDPKSTPVLAEINIYTDGSKTKEHTGSGSAIYRHKTEKFNGVYRLPSSATVFQAEIYAIKEAIREYSILRLQNEQQVNYLQIRKRLSWHLHIQILNPN